MPKQCKNVPRGCTGHYEGDICVSHTLFSGHVHVKAPELVYNKNKPIGGRTGLRCMRDQMEREP